MSSEVHRDLFRGPNGPRLGIGSQAVGRVLCKTPLPADAPIIPMTDLTSTPSGDDAHAAAAGRPPDTPLVPERLLRVGRRVNGVGEAGKGYADTLGHGIELTLTLVVFGAIGWWIDRSVGTGATFTIALAALGFIGISLRLWFGYDREMRGHEAGAIWNRGPAARAIEDDAT